jgi:hypothetical protein
MNLRRPASAPTSPAGRVSERAPPCPCELAGGRKFLGEPPPTRPPRYDYYYYYSPRPQIIGAGNNYARGRPAVGLAPPTHSAISAAALAANDTKLDRRRRRTPFESFQSARFNHDDGRGIPTCCQRLSSSD